MSAPGQTVGVSVFTDSLIESLGLSRSVLSLAYMAGTLASASLLSWAGRLYDRFGARLVATTAAAGLAATLVFLSFSASIANGISGIIGGSAAVAFVTITVGFFLVRLTGQGVLTLASRNMVLQWFEARRGLVNAIMGISISFGFSYAPRVFDAALVAYSWEGAWRLLALVLAGFAIVAWIVFRDTPEAHGLVPDGGPVKTSTRLSPETRIGQSFTLREARRTYSFWVFAITLFVGALLMTAYTFHIVSIFEDAGMQRSFAISLFFPASLIAVVFQFFGSWVSDRVKLKYFCVLQLLALIALSAGLTFLKQGFPVVLAVVGQGTAQGIFGITGSITWPRFFGRDHLGAISGFAAALTVAGSAVGPSFFSLGRDVTSGYSSAAMVCGIVSIVLLAGAFRAERPVHPDAMNEGDPSGN
jgi:MFS family permease